MQTAAKGLVVNLDLALDAEDSSDQVAVVAFTEQSWIQQALTRDAEAVGRALDDVGTRTWSRRWDGDEGLVG